MAGGCWNSLEQIGGPFPGHRQPQHDHRPREPDNVNRFRTLVDGVFTYWWNEKFSETVQGDWATEEDATPPPDSWRLARWYGVAHYLSYIFNDNLTGVWRGRVVPRRHRHPHRHKARLLV